MFRSIWLVEKMSHGDVTFIPKCDLPFGGNCDLDFLANPTVDKRWVMCYCIGLCYFCSLCFYFFVVYQIQSTTLNVAKFYPIIFLFPYKSRNWQKSGDTWPASQGTVSNSASRQGPWRPKDSLWLVRTSCPTECGCWQTSWWLHCPTRWQGSFITACAAN